MVSVDFDRISERCNELIDYPQALPLLIRCLIMRKWMNNLEKKGLYEKVIRECKDTMPKDYDEACNELYDWCKNNKDYMDLING